MKPCGEDGHNGDQIPDQFFFRGPMNYDTAKAEAEVRQHYATCMSCWYQGRRDKTSGVNASEDGQRAYLGLF